MKSLKSTKTIALSLVVFSLIFGNYLTALAASTNALNIKGKVTRGGVPVGKGYPVSITNLNKIVNHKDTTTLDDSTYSEVFFGFVPVAETGDVIEVVTTDPNTQETAKNPKTYESSDLIEIDVDFPAGCSIPWEVTQTPSSCDFYGIAEIAEGVPADPGDVIGSFAPDVEINDGCVGIFEINTPGYYGMIHVYGDDLTTEPKDGAVAGDKITFKILDRSECKIYETNVVSGDASWQAGQIKELNLRVLPPVIELHLVEGWNLISWPVGKCFYQGNEPDVPLPAGTETVNISGLGYSWMSDWFTSILTPNKDIGEIPWRIVQGALPGGAAIVMDSTLPPSFNTLKYMAVGYGYWVNMKNGTNGGTITLEGSYLAPDTTLSLAEGWNLIGWPVGKCFYQGNEPDVPLPAGTETVNISGLGYSWMSDWFTSVVTPNIDIGETSWRYVQASVPPTTSDPLGGAKFMDSTVPFPAINTLKHMSAGYGYWVNMKNGTNGGTITPEGSYLAPVATPSPNVQHLIGFRPTNLSMFIYGTISLDDNPASVGSKITVWTSNDVLVGVGTVEQTGIYGFLPIYGDDLTTDEVDGALMGEELIVKVDGYSTSPIIRWLGDHTTQRIDLVSKRHIIPSVSWLGQNYPNPFNPETWIPYALSESAEVMVQIYNVHGSIVRTLDLGEKSTDVYDTKELAAYWNGRNDSGEKVSSGLYFYKLTAGQFTQVKRMVILK